MTNKLILIYAEYLLYSLRRCCLLLGRRGLLIEEAVETDDCSSEEQLDNAPACLGTLLRSIAAGGISIPFFLEYPSSLIVYQQ